MSTRQTLFKVKAVDRKFYEERLKDFLPSKIIDIHTHVWLDKFKSLDANAPSRVVSWPAKVARDNSIEDLIKTYQLMFPGKEVTPLIFGGVGPGDDFSVANEYIKKSSEKYGFPSLIFASPEWSSEEFEADILSGGFLGCKVYLSLSKYYIPEKEIRIFDFLPHHQLKVLNKHGWIAMLHIPRDGRLRDPVNLHQMMEIEQRYPNVKLIIAHVGRAYCNEDIGDAFNVLSGSKNMVFDFSANTNRVVFEQLIGAVGSKRILFGSDMPILRMRTRRICENGKYINLVPKGLYGDVSDDSHMREVEGQDALNITFFMYEEIDAFRLASQAVGLNKEDIESIFYKNARNLINSVKGVSDDNT